MQKGFKNALKKLPKTIYYDKIVRLKNSHPNFRWCSCFPKNINRENVTTKKMSSGRNNGGLKNGSYHNETTP